MRLPILVAAAMTGPAPVAVIASLTEQLAALEAALTSAFGTHPDAWIVRSQPGLGLVLAARVLAEFGDVDLPPGGGHRVMRPWSMVAG